jgi:hypothetical protein
VTGKIDGSAEPSSSLVTTAAPWAHGLREYRSWLEDRSSSPDTSQCAEARIVTAARRAASPTGTACSKKAVDLMDNA